MIFTPSTRRGLPTHCLICAQVAPLNAIKNQGKNEGTVDNPFDPEELPEVAAADKACRTAMRFMRKLDRLRGNFDPRDSEADATAASTKNAATAALEACAAGAAPPRALKFVAQTTNAPSNGLRVRRVAARLACCWSGAVTSETRPHQRPRRSAKHSHDRWLIPPHQMPIS